MIRRAFRSGFPARAFVGQPAPVSGLTRMIVPSRPTGSPAVRRSWLRSEPPSAVGEVSAVPAAPGGSPHGFTGVGVRRSGPTVLTVVGGVEVRAVARRQVEGPFRTEHQAADRMARELLAPILDEDVLGTGHDATDRGQLGQPPRDDTTVGRGPRRIRASVVGRGRRVGRRPAWRVGRILRVAQDVVVRVQDVHVRTARREARVDGEAEHAPVPVVVDVRGQVGEDRRRGVGHARVAKDDALLLGHEDRSVGRDDGRHRMVKTRPDGLVTKSEGYGRTARRGDGRRGEGQQEGDEQGRTEQAHRSLEMQHGGGRSRRDERGWDDDLRTIGHETFMVNRAHSIPVRRGTEWAPRRPEGSSGGRRSRRR